MSHGEHRREEMSLAKTFVWKRNVSLEELDFAIRMMEDQPNPGYRARGILQTLRSRKARLFG